MLLQTCHSSQFFWREFKTFLHYKYFPIFNFHFLLLSYPSLHFLKILNLFISSPSNFSREQNSFFIFFNISNSSCIDVSAPIISSKYSYILKPLMGEEKPITWASQVLVLLSISCTIQVYLAHFPNFFEKPE